MADQAGAAARIRDAARTTIREQRLGPGEALREIPRGEIFGVSRSIAGRRDAVRAGRLRTEHVAGPGAATGASLPSLTVIRGTG